MGKVVLLFIIVILIGYHFDNSDKSKLYEDLYTKSVIDNNKLSTSNRFLFILNNKKNKDTDYLNLKLKSSEDSIKYYKKYKKLYSFTFKKDSLSLGK